MDRSLIIVASADLPSIKGAASDFVGSVRIEQLIDAPAPARIKGVWVTFEPGSRTNWHSHPLGQTLFVTFGVGRVRVWGEQIREISPGDTVWIGPNVKHWHGASPTKAMTHLALQEHLDGCHIEWHGTVSDDQYYKESESRS